MDRKEYLKARIMEGMGKKSGTKPMSDKEKSLAALAHPKDKITHKDVLVGRGVLKKEEVEQVDEVAKWRKSDREQFPHERGEAPFPAGMRDHPDYLSKKKKTFMHARPSKNPKDASYYRSTGDVYLSHLDDIGGGDRKIPLNRKGEPELSTDYLKDREQNLPRRKGKIVKTALKRAMLARKQQKEEVEQVDEASYSAKSARAGEDIGKPGKMFAKIAASASKKYGSEERGKKVAGAVLKKLRAKQAK